VKSLLFALLAALPAFADEPKSMPLIVQGDTEERQHHPRTALALFEEAEKIEPNNPGILLRISHTYFDLIDETKPPEDVQDAERSLEYAKRALVLDPNNAKAHLGVAVGYGKLTDFVGSKTKVEYSKVIKDETEKSIAIDPADDFAWYLLGRWNFEVANIGGMLKFLANVVYGGLPAASNEEAVRCYKKAAEIAPQRLMHHSALARAYSALGKAELAVKEWRTVLSLKPTDKNEETDKEAAERTFKLTKSD
jgi:tetratricopeptide (TPR) repeat protein